ncbi:MAG: trigger factor [Thermoleophilaceae bacterium]|nr:trigger factor [Thermoleophilaceae bacterium]
MSAVTAKTEEIAGSRVRVDVEVAADAVEARLDSAAEAMGHELKIPGFRKGKVPPKVVLQRMGREAVLDEAVRRALPEWYSDAVVGIATVGDPKVELAGLPDKGAPLKFSFEVGVRPKATLGDYTGLEAGRREAEVADAEIDTEVEALRESLASLQSVEREAGAGDFVVLDFVGSVDGEPFEGGEARGYLLELGSGRLIPGFEEQLTGASANDEREVAVTFPEDYGSEALAGKEAKFAVEVKEVREKQLPELDDEFAVSSGGFDSMDELREDVRGRMREALDEQIEAEYRENVLDAAVANATVDVPHDLVHGKAHEMWHSMARNLQRRGMDPNAYLQMTGKGEEELVTEMEEDAERSLKREAVLAAVIETEKVEVSDDELLETLRDALPDAEEAEVAEALANAKEQGRDDALREDIAMRKALDLMVESAKPIEAERAQAREEMWTPEKEAKEKSGKLWTPGS